MANAMCILCPLSTLVYPMYLFLFFSSYTSNRLDALHDIKKGYGPQQVHIVTTKRYDKGSTIRRERSGSDGQMHRGVETSITKEEGRRI